MSDNEDGWFPTSICKAIGPDGEFRIESRDEKEVRKAMKPGDTFYRLYEKMEQKWVERP